jgi:glutathione peroxidase-family protein
MTETPLTDIALTTLDGRPTTLAALADGAILVVNVASNAASPRNTPRWCGWRRITVSAG